jgi:hypothetical protein
MLRKLGVEMQKSFLCQKVEKITTKLPLKKFVHSLRTTLQKFIQLGWQFQNILNSLLSTTDNKTAKSEMTKSYPKNRSIEHRWRWAHYNMRVPKNIDRHTHTIHTDGRIITWGYHEILKDLRYISRGISLYDKNVKLSLRCSHKVRMGKIIWKSKFSDESQVSSRRGLWKTTSSIKKTLIDFRC